MFPVRWMEKRMFDHWTLSNGLHVVGERLPYLRSVSIGVWLRVGSMMEQPRENGLSHFLEHMVFKGTEKRNTRQIAEEMDAVGGQLNAFTGKDCTCFYAKVIDEDLPLAVDILSDMTLHATLDEGELNKERGVILEEISMEEVAAACGGFHYEIPCVLGKRVPRVYLRDGQVVGTKDWFDDMYGDFT